MSTPHPSDRARRRLAWTAPVIVAGVVVAGVALNSGAASGASPNLPARSAAQLIADVQGSTATTFSGQLSETANFGIPTLPGGHDTASFSWQTFLSGTHTARVWSDGADKQRIALTGELSEADVVHNGDNVWTYTSDTNTVTHNTLARRSGQTHSSKVTSERPDATDTTPVAIATKLLKAIDPTTKVTVDSTSRVAKHDAYVLVLAPRDTRSTVRKVTISIDATTYLPLRVQVFGSASSPAFSTGFTKINYTRPAASTFAFKIPAGAAVSKDPLGLTRTHGDHHRPRPNASPKATPGAAGSFAPKLIGSGWTSIVELPKGGASSALSGSMLSDLTSAVGTNGTRLLHTALLNAVILPDGRTFLGAVSPALLERVATTTR
ncbi:MAG: sigma-E factor regulatory protein RseB domain-containing protein [Jatrophihabitans sp.]